MKIVSVEFKENGKNYYFKCDKKIELKPEDKVVVDTVRGIEFASVVEVDVNDASINIEKMMPVVRKATKEDFKTYEKNIELGKQGMEDFKKILEEFPHLDMTLVSCEYNLDSSKILFMYISEGRVDFRDLLKRLASHFKKRIELMQIGARDKAKLVGGLGPCGMEICCSRYLSEFDNISINMAKNQMLSLNPSNISGLCGRLLCCLKYENDVYTKAKEAFPKIGSFVEYEKTRYKVTGLNLLSNQVKIENSGIIKLIDKDDAKCVK